ncbi:isoprenyl transferase [Paenibacillus flagellatus]|uniref:Isoprenyl transferase n=1 Tax=Paenibacillus flagellatus TaxID=2211139 RepID=A0A2V5KIJ1_9BACL|nr:isoprenyl transferase [Paenibacillus flagellatus]PYI54290.1 isoprenyl transferase [Paenibacillus flagellatus]
MLTNSSGSGEPGDKKTGAVPDHIAIMMDGNGRWAVKRGLPRTAGHYAGMLAMKETIRTCNALGVKCLTLYAFSTENWKRPREEVQYLVHLPRLFFQDGIMEELMRSDIRIKCIGDLSGFPESIRQVIQNAIDRTSGNTGMVVHFAMNYGGRAELVQAIKACIRDTASMEDITEQSFPSYLYTKEWSEPDLVIRTSGERRLSNFLLWQSAKAELMFIDTLWPDFDENHLKRAILELEERRRRA